MQRTNPFDDKSIAIEVTMNEAAAVRDMNANSGLPLLSLIARFETAKELLLDSDLPDNGIENVDYKVENGQYISLLKQGENLGDKYPVTAALAWLWTWKILQ